MMDEHLDMPSATCSFAIGNACLAEDDYPGAITAYREALRQFPNWVEAWYNCAVAYHHQGALDNAVAFYERAIRLSPDMVEAHFNLAHAQRLIGRLPDAEASLQKVLRLQTQNAAAAYQLGDLYQSMGRGPEALSAFQTALRMRPDYAEALYRIGLIWRQQELLEQAIICFEQALLIKPDYVEALHNLGLTHHKQGDLTQARYYYDRVLTHQPDHPAARWLSLLSLPTIYENTEEITAERQRFSVNLDHLISTTRLDTSEQRQQALRGIGASTNFFLQYQGQNDLELQRRYGRFVTTVMAANFPQWAQTRTVLPRTPSEKIRIGYISSFMHGHTVGLFLNGLLKKPNPKHFETFCYHVGSPTDTVTDRIRQLVDHFHHIPGNLTATANQIADDAPHILVYSDIGMDPATLQLAGLRLAPVQCNWWGHPVTTGLPTIDYYLSSDLMEPHDADQHYSETLIRLPNLALNYSAPPIPAEIKSRKTLGIPEDALVYLSTQSLFKYLPQHDDIYPRIASRVPDALFVFISHPSARVTERFKQRLITTFQRHGTPAKLLFLPRLGHYDFLNLNLKADILLDTIEWSGGHTTLEAITCNLPVVTLPGPFMRGRHTYAFLIRMGLHATIAKDKATYVQIAIKLGLDKAFHQAIRNHIRHHKALLFDDESVNMALAAFYRNVAQSSIVHPQIREAPALKAEVSKDPLNPPKAEQRLVDPQTTAEHHFKLGSALREKEQFEEALCHLAKAVELRPDHADAWNNLALACKNIGEFKRAMACLNRAIAIKPDLAEAHWNRSFLHLLNDDYDRGWSDFEWRFRIAQRRFIYPFDLPGARWNGTPDPSAAILVHDEQGMGDTLQFVRYLPLVKARCRKVILETRPNLLSLLHGQPGIDQIILRSTDGLPRADYDMHVPLMSLPKVFGTHACTIPAAMPYIVADPGKVAHWDGKLAGAAPKVGLVWSGNPHHTNDRNRSCPLATFKPLLEIPGIQFIGLQKGPGAEQAARLTGKYHFSNWDNEQRDFSDTAAIVSHLDLVITVDTAMAHLAGAMAKPVWLLLSYVPDWRWGLHRNDTPWYPTMRLFRQHRLKAWAPVVRQMTAALTAIVDQLRGHCGNDGHP